jgi:hypothetical protein
VGLTTPHHKKLLLRNLKRGGQGPTWAAGPLDGIKYVEEEYWHLGDNIRITVT